MRDNEHTVMVLHIRRNNREHDPTQTAEGKHQNNCNGE